MELPAATIIEKPISPFKAVRLARGLSQKAVAYGTPCGVSVVNDIEVYNYRPNREIQERLAAFFGVTRQEIFPDELMSPPCTNVVGHDI